MLAGVSYWALSQMENPPLGIGLASAPTPTPTPEPTNTPRPGLGITIPGAQGTPTTITLPIPGINATVGLPNLPIPGLSGSPGLPAITNPAAKSTPPPAAKLTADQARQKVKDSIASCRLLQPQIDLAQVTFEAPNWVVRLPLTGATWRVDDEAATVTPDERAAERVRTCRT